MRDSSPEGFVEIYNTRNLNAVLVIPTIEGKVHLSIFCKSYDKFPDSVRLNPYLLERSEYVGPF